MPSATRATAIALDQVRDYLAQHADQPIQLAALGALVGLSPAYVQRQFSARFALSPKAWQRACRERLLKTALRRGRGVADAVYAAGYGSGSRVYEHADQRLGMTPAQYAAGGRGVAMSYASACSPLGQVLIAASDHSVCAVFIGHQVSSLLRDLHQEFPKAQISPTTPGAALHGWLQWVVEELAGVQPLGPPPPVAMLGSAFQIQVWELLRKIPRGQTRSYRQLAEALQRPSASRAVARACATNRIALLIPCHRVIRGDGALAGYRWGIARKRRILAAEQ